VYSQVPEELRAIRVRSGTEPFRTQLRVKSGLASASWLVRSSTAGHQRVLPVGWRAKPLLRDPIRAYVPGAAEIRGLRQVHWVFYHRGTEAHAWARKVCHRAGFEPDVRYESADLNFHRRMVEADLAAAFLPDLLDGRENWGAVSSDLIDAQNVRDISSICRAPRSISRRSPPAAPPSPNICGVSGEVTPTVRGSVRRRGRASMVAISCQRASVAG